MCCLPDTDATPVMVQHCKKHSEALNESPPRPCKDHRCSSVGFSGKNNDAEFWPAARLFDRDSGCELSRGGNQLREEHGESERKGESQRHRQEFQIPLAQFEEN